MINEEAIAAYNNRLTANLNNIKTMSTSQQDRVKVIGSGAENLLNNKDFAQFIHSFKFEKCDELISIKGHTEVDNAMRIAIGNQLIGIDDFVASLQKAVFIKNKVVKLQTSPEVQ
jgi:hypothetical protein